MTYIFLVPVADMVAVVVIGDAEASLVTGRVNGGR